VHVLDGDVALTRQTLDGQIVLDANLSAGQAAAYRPEKGLAQVDFEADLFVADMREASLRPDFAGTNAAWFGQLSGDLRQDKRKADALQVFLERHDFILPEDAEVDFDREHAWKPQLGTGGHSVPAGERVDVYLLHFDLIDGHLKPEDFILDFGRPILGVIVSQATLDTTDGLFGLPSVTYPAFELDQRFLTGGHRGLNYRVDDDTDAEHALARKTDLASISPDGTRLKLRLWGGEPQRIARMDQVRVLVRSDRDRADSNNTGPVGLPTN